MILYVVNKTAQYLKRDKSYVLDSNLKLSFIIRFTLNRLLMVFRGFFFQIFKFSLPKRIIFLGKRTNISYYDLFYSGSSFTLGSYCKIDCLSSRGVRFGNNVSIGDNSHIRCTGVVSHLGVGIFLGNNVGIGHNNFINAQGGVTIKDDVIIGPNVTILAENHNFQSEELIRLQGVNRRGIVIENNVWIGANVTILDGVTIGSGSVIGAGSIVTKSIPKRSVAFGNPCKVYKCR